MNVCDLTTVELDILVARLEGVRIEPNARSCLLYKNSDGLAVEWAPSRNWTQGGPILERHRIVVGPWKGSRWAATVESFPESAAEVGAFGNTYLEAGMRCYVVEKLGADIDGAANLEYSVG